MPKPQNLSQLKLEQQRLSRPLGLKRVISWCLALPIFLAFLVLPWAAAQYPAEFEAAFGKWGPAKAESKPQPTDYSQITPPNNAHPTFFEANRPPHSKTFMALDSVWNPGPVASAHQAWEEDCQACHVGNFARVQNESCEACHGSMGEHVAAQELPNTSFEEPSCASCHRDHKGLESLAEQNKHFVGQDCADCHTNITDTAPKTATLPVSGFDDDDHPNFRVTLRENKDSNDLIRVRLKGDEMLQEPTTLKFPHDVHMDPGGVEGPNEIQVLGCADCHTPADTEIGFERVEMEKHCQACHSLSFEPSLPDREVPHGQSGPALDTIVEFYHFLDKNPQLKKKVRAKRATLAARPGQRVVRKADLSFTPMQQAEFAAQDLFENRACAVCHEITVSDTRLAKQTSGAQITQYMVLSVTDTHPWMPMAKFDHEAHAFESCDTCHQAKTSQKAEDVLMPGIAVCQDCHSGINTNSLNKVESNCGVCHGYHIHEAAPALESVASDPMEVARKYLTKE